MRGKHGAASANRREREELEQRAAKAEQRVERLESEAAELRERHARTISGLQAQLRAVTDERDNGVSPALDAAYAQIETGLIKVRDLNATLKDWENGINRLKQNMIAALSDSGLPLQEIQEITGRLMKNYGRVTSSQIEAALGEEYRKRSATRSAMPWRAERPPIRLT